MSAPTAVDAGAVREGLAWHVDPPSLVATAVLAPPEGERRDHTSSVAQLSRTHNELCTQAVDSFEIAAGLEAAGINDRIARLVYNSASVFDLAETLFSLVPRRPADMGAPVDRWHRPFRLHLVRGLLYGLPGLLYAVAFGALQPGYGPVLLLTATITSCGLAQGISVIGNMLIGWGEQRAAMSLFRSALIVGAGALVLLAAVGALSTSLLGAAVLAGLQLEYMLAASVLLVLGADKLLLRVLIPGVVLAAACLAGLDQIVPRLTLLAVLALCPLAAVCAAANRIRAEDAGAGRSVREVLSSSGPLRRIGWLYVAYGVVNAGLVSFAVIDVLSRGDDSAGGPIVLMMLPLVASLGVAEWLVHRLRTRGVTVLHETTSARAFRSRAVTTLVKSLAVYGGVLALLVIVVVLLYRTPEPARSVFVLSTVSYAALGLALLLQTLLLSLGRASHALALASSALAVDTVLRWWLASEPAETQQWAHLAVYASLLFLLIPTTAAQYRSVGMHR